MLLVCRHLNTSLRVPWILKYPLNYTACDEDILADHFCTFLDMSHSQYLQYQYQHVSMLDYNTPIYMGHCKDDDNEHI